VNDAAGSSQSGWRVFGDPAKFRRKVRERVTAGRHMADELIAVRQRLPPEPDAPPQGTLASLALALDNELIAEPLEARLASWQGGNRSLLLTRLGTMGEGVLGPYHQPQSKAPGAARIDAVEDAIATEAATLDALLKTLGPGRRTDTVGPAGIRLDELETSGLLDPEVIEAFRRRMSRLGTRRGVSAAIGAAKELVEAVHTAALNCLGEPAPKRRDDFLSIAKQVRAALDRRQPAPDPAGSNTLLLFQTHQAGLLQDLDELRYLYGTGHGRTGFPRGLAARHGRLAIDVAETYVRFLVATLGDLGLLG
jgi:hypothetical protein